MNWELNTRIAAGSNAVFHLIAKGRLLLETALFVWWAAQDSNLLCFHVPVLQTGATPPSWRAAHYHRGGSRNPHLNKAMQPHLDSLLSHAMILQSHPDMMSSVLQIRTRSPGMVPLVGVEPTKLLILSQATFPVCLQGLKNKNASRK